MQNSQVLLASLYVMVFVNSASLMVGSVYRTHMDVGIFQTQERCYNLLLVGVFSKKECFGLVSAIWSNALFFLLNVFDYIWGKYSWEKKGLDKH